MLLWVGAVLSPAYPGGVAPSHPLDGLTVGPVEPLAVRLALLTHPHGEAVRITAADLASAQDRLTRWRTLVADLAWSPSQPAADEVVGPALAGLATDLDATAALQALTDLEKRSVFGDGSRFESYLLIDRILALELGRDIGRQAASGT
jgi:cysteinyl-tRNA synthetase